MLWFGFAEIPVIPAVVCSGVPVFIAAGRGAVPASDLTTRPGTWDWLHPMGLGRWEPAASPIHHGAANQGSTVEAAQC